MTDHQPSQSAGRRRASIPEIVSAVSSTVTAVVALVVAVFLAGPCPPPSKPVPAGAPVHDDLRLEDTAGDGGQMPAPAVTGP